MERANGFNALPEGVTLRRVSWVQRTVRQEWSCPHCGGVHYCLSFVATAQEWERAHD